MYEELIKSLRLCREIMHEDDSCIEFVDGSCEAFPICAYQLMEKAADAIEELSRENKEIMFRANQLEAMNDALIGETGETDALIVASKPRWIPVTERLPAVGKKVLVFSYGNDILTARRHKQKENGYPVFECNGIFREMAKPGRISHWMPLPEPPKEET